MVDPRIICRACPACTSGMDNICPKWGYIGLSGGRGGGAGFSEFVNVEQRMCHPLPDDGTVDLDSVVLCQPLTVGRHPLASSGMGDLRGRNVLVLGGGAGGVGCAAEFEGEGGRGWAEWTGVCFGADSEEGGDGEAAGSLGRHLGP